MDISSTSRLHADAPSAEATMPALLEAELDDRTIAYALAMRTPFEGLRQAAAQLAGILVLMAAGSRTATPDHPMFALACRSYDEAMDAIRAATPPPQGRHHHRHLTGAALWIGRALARARVVGLDIDTTLPLLRRGWQELQWTSGALPGFEIVAFEQACCARHARARAPAASAHRA